MALHEFDASLLPASIFDPLDAQSTESDNPVLRRLILDEIGASGPMTFHRFMELALYHPTEGYYTSRRMPVGPHGDYVTSPEVSASFGYAVAAQIACFWRNAGAPARFEIREFGAGNGRLARDILGWTAARDAALHAALNYTLVDIGTHADAAEQAVDQWLRTGKATVISIAQSESLPPMDGVVLANELLDSLPVHRVVRRNGVLRELYVSAQDGAFVGAEGDLSTPEVQQCFSALGISPGEGCVAEVNVNALAWMKSTAAMLNRGYVLLFDYGYPAERLYAPWRRNGTLLCYHRHNAGDDPYLRVGRQDLTAHVDFTSISAAARDAGLEPLSITRQDRFLAAMGLTAPASDATRGPLALEDFYTRKRAVEALLDPLGLGRIGVLLFGKGVESGGIDAFLDEDAASDASEREWS